MPDKLYYTQGSAFQAICYYKFGHRKQYSVRELASFLSIGEEYAYKLIGGTKPITADIAKKIIEFVAAKNGLDTELLEFFCPDGLIPVRTPAGRRAPTSSLEKDQILLSILNGDALKSIEEALGDGKIDRAESRRIERTINRLLAKGAELKERVRRETE